MAEVLLEFVQRIRGMQWSDYLDIIVVAFLIYKLLPLIRTQNMMRITRTVIAVVAIAWITDVMELHTLHWILNQFLAVGLLAFVILFQPELRRMLEHLANVKIGKLFSINRPIQETEAAITQTVMACEIMSRERVGALIVFAREQRLDEFYKSGTRIDGLVSEQLLRNLFFPKAALHDGAVIIRDTRVAAAGCVLPLSENYRLSADLGTRHRAGVGMSETSDAVVVIVSEETGTISVAVGGMLKRHLEPATLEKLLRNELCPEESQQNQQNIAGRIRKKLKNRRKEEAANEKPEEQ